MPPSNYFSKVFDGAVEDEEDLEEEKKLLLTKTTFCCLANLCLTLVLN
jgi:hypothetical protein